MKNKLNYYLRGIIPGVRRGGTKRIEGERISGEGGKTAQSMIVDVLDREKIVSSGESTGRISASSKSISSEIIKNFVSNGYFDNENEILGEMLDEIEVKGEKTKDLNQELMKKYILLDMLKNPGKSAGLLNQFDVDEGSLDSLILSLENDIEKDKNMGSVKKIIGSGFVANPSLRSYPWDPVIDGHKILRCGVAYQIIDSQDKETVDPVQNTICQQLALEYREGESFEFKDLKDLFILDMGAKNLVDRRSIPVGEYVVLDSTYLGDGIEKNTKAYYVKVQLKSDNDAGNSKNIYITYSI